MTVPKPVDVRAALRHLRKVDGPMRELIARHGAPDLRSTRNSFESLGRAIVYQQLSGAAAGTIYGRFLDLFPRRRFPKPEVLAAMSVAKLRSVGLSRGKASFLIDLAEKFRDGVVRPRRFRSSTNDALRDMLTIVKGIGPWSVDMFLMFHLTRPDVLPVGDLGVQKGFKLYFGLRDLPKPVRMERLAEPWRPYRTVGSWYMWRILEGGLP